MGARVFLPVLSSRFNLEAAKPFGEIVYLIQTDDRSPFQTDSVIHEFIAKLDADRFDPLRDFVALTGPSIFVALLMSLVLVRYRHIRALLFHAASSRYVERVLDSEAWAEGRFTSKEAGTS